jgi:hypothetical protein
LGAEGYFTEETPYAPKTMAGHPKLRPQLFPKRAQAAG